MQTVMLKTAALKPGMITAETCWNNNQVVLQSNTVLTSSIIRRLPFWGIQTIRVQKRIKTGDVHSALLNENLPAAILQDDPEFVDKYRLVTSIAAKLLSDMRKKENLPYEEMHQLATVYLYDLLQTDNVVSKLYKLKTSVDYTFLHAVDVGIIAGMLGKWYGFREKDIKTLLLCGVMHDIGKMQIPPAILVKPGRLTPEERKVVNLHPRYGYYMAQSVPTIPHEVPYAILHHHEREHGGGYPDGLNAAQIHPFAKIIAIADTYDALTTDKAYQKSVTPFEALEILTDQMAVSLEKEYCRTFIRNIAYSLMGSTVLLSDGTQGQVLQMDHFMSLRPVVNTADGELIDLFTNSHLSIVEILQYRISQKN